jgi:hypothetical protein
MKTSYVGLVVLPVLLAAASPAQQFNLNCSGTRSTSSYFGDRSELYSTTYRLDLDKAKWCDGECKALHEFAAILPTQIQFENSKTDSPSERSATFNFVDRETGAQMISATSSSPRDGRSIIVIKWIGQCERSTFSGFPKFDTKF